MDPYLEAPGIWADFHDALAGEIRGELNRVLPEAYYARLEIREEVGIVEEEDGSRWVVPGVTVVRSPRDTVPAAQRTALAEPRTEVSQAAEFAVTREPVRHQFVEIRDPSRGHHLVTLIEIVSPSNKLPGPDRRAYLRKQNEVLESDANLIQLDLLRSGERLLPTLELEWQVEQLHPRPQYLFLLSRAWRREEASTVYEIFPFTLRDVIPCIPVPLRQEAPEVGLDLQWVFSRAYDRGPYRRGAIDYSQPSHPPLADDDADWSSQLLLEQQL